MRGSSLQQPLVSRPAYGEGRGTVAESGLPGGGPSNKGLPLDSGIPGTSTFTKPQDAPVRDFDKGKDESIYRTDNADDLLTDRERVDTREDNADKHDGIGGYGKGEWDKTGPKSRYPYRDGIPNTHSSVDMGRVALRVLARWEEVNYGRLPPEELARRLKIRAYDRGARAKRGGQL